MSAFKPLHFSYTWRIILILLTGIFAIFAFSLHQFDQKSFYIHALQNLAFAKYIDLPVGYDSISHTAIWDAYLFTAPEFRCVMGGPFGLLVHRGTETQKTVLWLQAGQECWPFHPNCGGSATYTPEEAMQYEAAGLDGGPFGPAKADKNNPVANWNFVYVPSCDGSFHFGDAAADYDKDGNIDHFHNGLRQTSAAVGLMKELFPETKEVLIFGSSTGGFGTFGAAPLVRLVFPDTRLNIFNDSGPGIFNPEKPEIWPEIIQTWNLSSMLPADCQPCSQQLLHFYDWMLDHDPNLKIALFSSRQDAVVADVVGMNSKQYEQTLMDLTNKLNSEHAMTFKRYFIQGDSHTLGDFYRKENGITLWKWLAYFVEQSPQWVDLVQ
jgi:hypothetical protein